jgi:hypothetical protein
MPRINVYASDNGHQKLIGWFDDDKTTVYLSNPSCCDSENAHTRDYGPHQNLMRTANGRWVLNEFTYVRASEFGEDSYYFLSDDQVKNWLATNHYDKEYAEYFGEMPDEVGPGRPEIGGEVKVRLGALLPEVDEWAAANGVKRAEAIRRLIGDALGAARMMAR